MIGATDRGKLDVIRYTGRSAGKSAMMVVGEAWVEIRCNGIHVTTLACSPFDLSNLVVGHLYFRGLIEHAAQVMSIEVDRAATDHRIKVDATIDCPAGRIRAVTGATPWIQFEDDIGVHGTGASLASTVRLSPERVTELMRQLYARATHYQESRGIHAAGVSDGEQLVAAAEDLSRHCAVDKVIGRIVTERAPAPLRVLCTTGRLSSGLICRAYHAGIEVLLSRTSVTELSASLATRLGVTLVGYIRADAFTIYTGAERVAITISDAPSPV